MRAPRPISTERDMNIMDLLGDGFSHHEVAARLKISANTVRSCERYMAIGRADRFVNDLAKGSQLLAAAIEAHHPDKKTGEVRA